MLSIWSAFCLQFMNSFIQVTFKLIYTNVGWSLCLFFTIFAYILHITPVNSILTAECTRRALQLTDINYICALSNFIGIKLLMYEADNHSHVIPILIMCAASSHINCLPSGPHHMQNRKWNIQCTNIFWTSIFTSFRGNSMSWVSNPQLPAYMQPTWLCQPVTSTVVNYKKI